jgi:hypothetical protein
LVSKITYSKGRKVVLGRMERQVLMCVKALLKRQERCPGQDGETGVDVVSKALTQKAGRLSWAGWRDRC